MALVEREFIAKGWQVILLTYDKVWFDLAQLGFQNPDSWVSCEIEIKEIRDASQVLDVPVLKFYVAKPAEHFLQVARSCLSLQNQDVRAAALYARVALEVKLKSYCSSHKVQVPYDLDGRNLKIDHFLDAIERRCHWTGTMALILFNLQRVKLFRDGVLNPSAHFHPVNLAKSEVEDAIRAVELLQFPKNSRNTADFPKKAAGLLAKPAPSLQDLTDAACYVRTTFEMDLRGLLSRHGGTLRFRDDWSKIELTELWESAKTTMTQVNNALATALIRDVEAHPNVFLNEWKYSHISALTKAQLDAAWAALRVPARATPQTRLAAFA